MKRREEELPWAVSQEVSTRWNSQFLCMKSVLKSEAAIRHVLATGEFSSMKSLVRNMLWYGLFIIRMSWYFTIFSL